MPKTLVRGDQALHVAPARAVGCYRTARQHHLQNMQELLGHLEIALVAGVMKCDQDLIGETPAIPGRSAWTCFATDLFVSLNHTIPHASFGEKCLDRRRTHRSSLPPPPRTGDPSAFPLDCLGLGQAVSER